MGGEEQTRQHPWPGRARRGSKFVDFLRVVEKGFEGKLVVKVRRENHRVEMLVNAVRRSDSP